MLSLAKVNSNGLKFGMGSGNVNDSEEMEEKVTF